MTPDELIAIKKRINKTLLKRTGDGDASVYAGPEYSLSRPKKGEPMTAEAGEKTIDLLLNVTNDFPELGSGTKKGGEIPSAFNVRDINRICDELDADLEDPDRGGFVGIGSDGKYVEVPGGIKSGRPPRTERNHCAGACTGICVGSCVGMCNGCLGCTSSCEAGANAVASRQ